MVRQPDVAQSGVHVQKTQANVILGSLLRERNHALWRDVACKHNNVVVALGGGVHQDGLERYGKVGDKEVVAGEDENNVIEAERQLAR